MPQDVDRSLEIAFTCPLPSGIHARPASYLADCANRFVSEITLTNRRSGSTANAKSVLAIIAADVRYEDECSLRIQGSDEQAALNTMRRFVEEELPVCDEPAAEIATNGAGRTLPRFLQHSATHYHFGVGVVRGIAQGKIVLVRGISLPQQLGHEKQQGPRAEQERVMRAIGAVRLRIEEMLSRQVTSTEAALLKAHLAIVGDISLVDKIHEAIAQGRSAGQAIVEGTDFFIDLLRHSGSLYIRERAVDMQEICMQLLQEIYGRDFEPAATDLTEPSVVVAETLAPQQLLALDRRWLKALVLESAGTTSHAIILARSFGIPTIVGVKDALLALSARRDAVVDANRGLVIVDLTPEARRFYDRELETLRKRRETLSRFATFRAATTDGQSLEVAANVSSGEEVVAAFESGADGIGLFRTEILLSARESLLSEEQQFEIYAQAARVASARPVIIRMMDIGGDKPLPQLNLPREANPFLGFRGIRIYPEHRELFRAQLRAIIRSSAFGRIWLMAPMVSSLSEVLWLKRQIVDVQNELRAGGVSFDPTMPVGIMIEVPSVAFALDELSKELDFFSIGTNDLSQYFFAVDRENAKVGQLSSIRQPAFLRFLKQIVDEVRKQNRWIGMCGEMAGDVRNLPLLVALGLDEISAPSAEVPVLKEGMTRLSAQHCRELFQKAAACRETHEVDALLESESAIMQERALLDRELIIFNSQSQSKEEAIREIVDAFLIAGRTADPEGVEEAIWKRESVYSTGLGYGFAIPHCKTDAVSSGCLAILKLQKPIEWESLDGEPVRAVILLALRETDTNVRHMQVFAKLARKLMDEHFREELRRVGDADAMLNFMSKELDIALETGTSAFI